MLDDDDEPVRDVITMGLQNLLEENKNSLSDYNEAFRNLQARRRRKPSFLDQPQRKWLQQMFLVTIEDPQRKSEVSEVGGSESGARMAVRSDDIEKKQKMLLKMMSLSQE